MNEKETYPTQRKWFKILFLLVPLCLVVLLIAFSNAGDTEKAEILYARIRDKK
jgi:hypothetical protein